MLDRLAEAGTIGFIVASSRPEAYFAYVVVAKYVNTQRLTARVFECLVRVARCLLATEVLSLSLSGAGTGTAVRGKAAVSRKCAQGKNFAGFVVIWGRGAKRSHGARWPLGPRT